MYKYNRRDFPSSSYMALGGGNDTRSEQSQPAERIQILLTRHGEHAEPGSPIMHSGDALVKVVEVPTHVRLFLNVFQLLKSQDCAARRRVAEELRLLDYSDCLCARTNRVRAIDHSIPGLLIDGQIAKGPEGKGNGRQVNAHAP
jgi:hypothetical protein